MRPYQLATQTTNTHNKHTCMRQQLVDTKMIKTQNDIQHYKHTHHVNKHPTDQRSAEHCTVCDARVHYPRIKQQEPYQRPPPPPGQPTSDASDTQQRITQPTHHSPPRTKAPRSVGCRLCSTSEHPQPRPYERGSSRGVLLRKEVIQPHLPVRLPCYDFVPIASPTFDGSPHKGWATGFGCCRLS